ncbi:L-lysine 23-aminomutase protein [Rutstroemia sp. NJR-2017a BBW]|nr:L-lysine 23-aminomutase protein [Rutstroemia sp. NJR-2017a BBW]
MLSSQVQLRSGTLVKRHIAALSSTVRIKPAAGHHVFTSIRTNSTTASQKNLPFTPIRQFRSNAPGQAAVTTFPRFDEHAMPRPEQPAELEGYDQSLGFSQVPGQQAYHDINRPAYWQSVPRWKDISHYEFCTQKFQVRFTIPTIEKLEQFLDEVLPPVIPEYPGFEGVGTREAFIKDVRQGIEEAPMMIRLTPHVLSIIDWNDPIADPIRRQFIPMKSSMLPDHPKLELDSLHEHDDSPVDGLVHRYPTKALFLATTVCPLYCRFCTRSWSVGPDTKTVSKNSIKPSRGRWEQVFQYIESTPKLADIVISGGDCYMLTPDNLRLIGERLLSTPHIKRLRFATKGLAISPSRIIDENDPWTDEIIRLNTMAKELGKSIAIHTHFNHPKEITWVTELALQKLHRNSVTVRNQSVLLRGVNDNFETMSELIRKVADNNVIPYYVYQADMVRGVEDLRTPLSTIIDLERRIRGTIGGMVTPTFVVDLPAGGGKRLACSFDTYDRKTGRSTFTAPSITGGDKENKVYEYWDPLHSLPE